jgi:hypothetical protein
MLLADIVGKENIVFDITAQRYSDYPVLKPTNDLVIQMASEYGSMLVTSSGYLYPVASQK